MPQVNKNTASTPLTLDSISASLPNATPGARLGSYTSTPAPTMGSGPRGRQGRSIATSLLLMSLFALLSGLLVLWTRMIVLASDPQTRETTLAQVYRGVMTTIDTITSYPGIQTLQSSFSGGASTASFHAITSSSLPYVFKRELSDSLMDVLISSLLVGSQTLRQTQTEIAKYGFLDPEIMSLLHTDQNPIPIITSLHTIETIKFATSLQMFSLLDTFLQQTSRLVDLPKETVAQTIKTYLTRGEKDIARFLTTCYLNPYESFPGCNQIGDFANYFRFEDQETGFNPSLFAQIMSIVDNKLEQSELPSLQIEFDRFAPNAQSLGFRVTVNTLPEDEREFMNNGIINPHIFIISQLVNLLKQSLFVLGESINVNTLNIQRNTINIGDIQIPVSTSKMNFNLPLQNDSQREITDFYQSR